MQQCQQGKSPKVADLWTTEIAILRNECVQNRILYKRAVNMPIITQTWIYYQYNRKKLRDEIKKTKKLS